MFCIHCGKQIAEDFKFCPHCGKKTDNTPGGATTSDGIHVIEKKDPLFRVECEYCHCVFEYRSKHLGYRIWYPSGFVYCPSCKKPLRHRLEYEVIE
jgi:predicted amidophosphoribosyltransferase